MTNEAHRTNKTRPALPSLQTRCCVLSTLIAFAAIVPSGLSQTSTEPAIHADQERVLFFNVRDYGATGEGKALDTSAITAAIKAASSAGGGRVLFPPGTYLTGTFELLSNVQLDLTAGAVIQGSKNVADYASITEYGCRETIFREKHMRQ